MQKAALSHARSLRWLLARLDNLGSEPSIRLVRIRRGETTFVLDRGIVHNPNDWKALRGRASRTEEIEEKEEVQGPEAPLPGPQEAAT